MIERKTVIDQIEIQRDGRIGVRLAKRLVDGDKVLASQPHRMMIEPGDDLGAQLAFTNDNLVATGEAPISDAREEILSKLVKLVHTRETVEQFASTKTKAVRADLLRV